MSDARTRLIRNGVACVSLEGLEPADAYRAASVRSVDAPVAPLRNAPEAAAEQVSQLLYGEAFRILETAGGCAYGQSLRDGYVGYLDLERLAPVARRAGLRVCAIRTYAFTAPSIKSLAYGLYSLNSLIEAEDRQGRFVKARGGGWFIADHLAPVGQVSDDPAAVAQRFLGAPYLWGGVESLGLDCSGLVQQSLRACGLACPRDSDQQQHVGQRVAARSALRRSDLVFWRGHVALMLDGERMIHANAHHMAVAIESLDQACLRIAANGGGEITAMRRL